MKKIAKIAMVSLITASYVNASNIRDPFLNGNMSGQIRTAYVNQDNALNPDTYGTAIGGLLKFETEKYNDISLGITAYMSQKISFASGHDETLTHDFFDANGNSFIYMGEGYIDYAPHNLDLRIGRQRIETPFVNGDDVRMLPNTFEGVMAYYTGIDNTTLTAGYLYRWAGFDSPQGHHEHINQFNQFGKNHDSSGVFLMGITNKSVDALTLQGWAYSVDSVTNVVYADASYTLCLGETAGMEFVSQYALLREDQDSAGVYTGVDGSVYGLGVNLNVGMLALGIAYNSSFNDKGKHVNDGLGGGPYYTSMEEMTIDGMEDAQAYHMIVKMDMAALGGQRLSLCAGYGEFKSAPMEIKITETDIIAAYQHNEKWSTDVSYAKIEDKNKNFDAGNDAGYSRFLARVNYTF